MDKNSGGFTINLIKLGDEFAQALRLSNETSFLTKTKCSATEIIVKYQGFKLKLQKIFFNKKHFLDDSNLKLSGEQ